MRTWSSLLVGLVACRSDPAHRTHPTPDPSIPVPTVDTAPEPVPTGSTGTTGDTATAPPSAFDCASIPAVPSSVTALDAPRGYNDLVFDLDGAMIGSDQSSLVRATGATEAAVYAPTVGMVYKMGRLPGGDVVAARSAGAGGGIARVTPKGGVTLLGTGILGYGLAVGSDGQIYTATNYTASGDAIVRVDPDSGAWEIVVEAAAFPPRAIAFSRDFSRLYWGTLNGGGVYAIDLDAYLDPVGPAELVATLPEDWHDTLEVDACGNLYVGSVFGTQIFRVRTDGTIEVFIDWASFDDYGHGFEWGDAAGGWNEQAIYVTHPYVGSRVSEFVIGVPGAQWTGDVIGGATL